MPQKLALLLFLAAAALQADDRAQWEKHKAEVLQAPSLLRYYVFEEGRGEEVRDLAKSEPGTLAMSGGPRGSLYILRDSPYGTDRRGYMYQPADTPSPEWTQGRWPWKSALTNGLEPRCVFRSGFSGADAFMVEAWLRVHPGASKEKGCSILNIGGVFSLNYGSGRITARVGSTTGVKVLSAPLPEGVWRQLACGLGGGQLKLFVDGKLAASCPFDGKFTPPDNKGFGRAPFVENRGDYLQIGGKPTTRHGEGRFDLDELAIFAGPPQDADVAGRYLSGKPAAEFPIAARPPLSVDIPKATWGYFPRGEAIPVSVAAAKGQSVELTLSDLKGKTVWSQSHLVDSAVWETTFRPELNGVYFLDAALKDVAGKVLRRLPEPYCVGVAPPPPPPLSGNPMGLQAALDPWSFGMPYYRQFIWGPGLVKQNLELLETFKKAGRPCLPIYTLAFDHDRYKTIGEKEEREIRAFVTEAAEGLKDVARYWEITNEPNGKFSPDTYMKLLKICSSVLREKSPGVPIVAPGASPSGLPFIKEIMRQGARDYFDILSFHDYQAFPIRDGRKQRTVEKLRQIVAESGSKPMPVWCSESGAFSLPRIGQRPMTADEAKRVGFKGDVWNGKQTFETSMATATEEAAAARQSQHILFELAAGFEKYIKCQGPSLFAAEGVNANALPSLMGVALTALSTVLNPMAKAEELPLASQDDACVVITALDGKRTAALFSDASPTLHFLAAPDHEYKGMDMLGNPLSWKSGTDGLLDIAAGENPVYVFDIPADFKEVALVKLAGPARLPDSGVLAGTVTVSNPFQTPLRGELSFLPLEGARLSLDSPRVDLAPGQSATFPFKLVAERLKRKNYTLQCQLKDAGKLTASSSFVFASDGAVIMVPEAKGPIALDGDDADWKDIPADGVQDESGVVKGKPNLAELWLPQWRDANDLSFSVKCAWRERDGLYLLLKVKDDHFLPVAPADRGLAFQWDCLELFFDARPYGKRGGPVSQGADQLIVIPSATGAASPCDLWYVQKDKALIEAKFVGRKTVDGYLLEGKLSPRPGSNFKPLSGEQFCMDFMLDDTDAPEQKRKTIMALHGDANGSCDSSSWGRYQLEPAK